jgi:ribose 5-phosphate isomerase A
MKISEQALDFVKDGHIVGLGTGRAATEFVHALGKRVRSGLNIQGVPTSDRTAELATELSIPLLSLEEAGELDVAIDGADEVDPQLEMIKGYGGAHVREKIVESCAKKLVILVGDEKVVSVLGERGKLPVEVTPFALPTCQRRLAEMNCKPNLRMQDDKPYVTNNGNFILDCGVRAIEDPRRLDTDLLAIPGVLETGLFVGMADVVLVQRGEEVEEMKRVSETSH